jgi:asparagine synthase (glutamine-hydrolysing)
MTNMIHHRGPDDSGFIIDKGLGIGFRRLSIIDLNEGHQPLSNEDGTIWVVLNGEIYNYKQLREMLAQKGHRFRSHSDTEVIVHLYEQYGRSCLRYLRGMFTFAVWDNGKQELFAARDYFGIKPLYYYKDNEKFIFASEIKSILAAEGIKQEVSSESLLNFLTFQYVPEPNTMFEGIYKLPPAHWMHVSGSRITIKEYWNPGFEPVNKPLKHYVEELRGALTDSVKHHMQSDVRRGCLLSSGIDSTGIAALMSKEEPIKTFSVGFEGSNNECFIARETAAALGTEHYEKIITPEEYFDAVPKAIWHQDEPVADPSAIALYFVARLAREHVTVVLSGEGADELFGGYRIYREPLALKPFDFLPAALKGITRSILTSLPFDFKGRNYLLRGTTPMEERFMGNAKIFTEDLKAEITKLNSSILSSYRNPVDIAGSFYSRVRNQDNVTKMQYIDLNLWLPGNILMKADKMTMAHSLELRVPYLDREVFEVARHVPAQYRVCNGTTKYVLRQAMKGLVPDTIVDRPKLGFPVPLRDWLRGNWSHRVLEMIQAGGIGDYIRLDAVEKMIKQHAAGQGDMARKIWTLYIFAEWHSTFINPADQYVTLTDPAKNHKRTVRLPA